MFLRPSTDRMIAMVEGAKRQKTRMRSRWRASFWQPSLFFIKTTVTLCRSRSMRSLPQDRNGGFRYVGSSLVCSSRRRSGSCRLSARRDRTSQANVIAASGAPSEAAGDGSFFLLDKTGTIARAKPSVCFIHRRYKCETPSLTAQPFTLTSGGSVVVLRRKNTAFVKGDVHDQTNLCHSPLTRMSGVDSLTEGDRKELPTRSTYI